MLLQYRHRRGNFVVGQERQLPGILKKVAAVIVLLVVLYFLGSWTLRLFGVGNTVARDPTTVHLEETGTVQITFEGGDTRRAENRVKVYPGETVKTEGRSFATLRFFDGTLARLNENTHLSIVESTKGEEESTLELKLERGSIWVSVASQSQFSGAIVRTLETSAMELSLVPRTEALIAADAFLVFEAAGAGITVDAIKGDAPAITVGEGQQFDLKGTESIAADLYTYRSPIKQTPAQATFSVESRTVATQIRGDKNADDNPIIAASDDVLKVTAPKDNDLVAGATVIVSGTVGETVASVKVNTYNANIDTDAHTFTQELAVPEGGNFTIDIRALNANGETVGEARRIVKRDLSAFPSPTITTPAKHGETHVTKQEEIVIRGGAPAGAAGIMVNDYQLKLFDPEKGEWSYVASTALGNLKQGENIYNVVALDGSGRASAPVRLTVILGDPPAGVASSAASAAPNPATLPANAPLKPGTLKVTGPTAGTTHTETGTGFLLEGATDASTASVWVNDYKLQLYTPGKTFWNYIASVEFQTLKAGTNVYKIVARNAENQIVDQMEYTVEFNP